MRLRVLLVMFCVLVLHEELGAEHRKEHRRRNRSRSRGRMRGTRWWNLADTPLYLEDAMTPAREPLIINPSFQTLTRKQRRLVHKNPGTITALAKGARMAIDECKFQFRKRRWNCPTVDANHGGPIFGKIVRKGCRETAFIYAITSAAVAHSVAKACSEGSIFTCSCGMRASRSQASSSDWEWGGCSDNAQFGHKFSREFVDVVEKGSDLRYMMNLHNNEAGRLHISTAMEQQCKCHGMSGSCTMKSCWMRLPGFRNVGYIIKDKFDGASKVIQDNSATSNSVRVSRGNTKRRKDKKYKGYNLIPINENHKRPEPFDLVYYENSPSFCDPDASVSFRGVRGRECNATSIGIEGCDLMCCSKGYRTEYYIAKERCKCVFHWCCEVTCKTCTRTRVRHICN